MRRLPRVHGYYGKLHSRKRQDRVSEKSSGVAVLSTRRAVSLRMLVPRRAPGSLIETSWRVRFFSFVFRRMVRELDVARLEPA